LSRNEKGRDLGAVRGIIIKLALRKAGFESED
jgi:hypothetical protein